MCSKGVVSVIVRALTLNRTGPHWHVNDRMVYVLPRRSGGQADNILGLNLPHDLFERESGNVVAFVNDYLAILGNEVLHFILSVEALNDSDVHTPRSIRFPATNMPDGFGR